MIRWESHTRYYTARIERDLLGDLIVRTVHGGRFTKLGGVRDYMVPDQQAAEKLLQRINRLRLRHEYDLVRNDSGIELPFMLSS